MKITRALLLAIIILLGNNLNAQNSNISSSNHTEQRKDIVQTDNSRIFPVILKFDTLFYIRTDYAGVSAEDRARNISKRIKLQGKDYNEISDSIYIRKGIDFVDVMFNNELVFTINKSDADAEGVQIDIFGDRMVENFKNSLLKHKYHLSTQEWIKRISFTLIALVLLILILWSIKFLFTKLNARLVKLDKKLLKKRNNIFKYFIPKNTKNIFVFLSHAGQLILTIILLFMYLPLLFSFLPWTQGIVDVFYGYIEMPILFFVHGLIDFIPDLFFIVVILYITRYFVRVMHDMFDDIDEEKLKIKSFPRDWANPTRKLFTVILYAFGLVMVFPHLPGSDSPAFKGVSLFLGVLFSLGSTSAIANMVAGIVITYMRPFQIGDRVQILDTVGDVIEKTLLITRIRTSKNEDVTIPNATIISNQLVNFSSNVKTVGLILHTEITLGYNIPWRDVEKYLLKAAKATKLLQNDPKPFILQTSLDDYYVTYELNVYTKQAKKTPIIMAELNRNILDVFHELGIEILSPKYVASRDGNNSTSPDKTHIDLRNPIEKIADHLTGKNQKNKVSKAPEKITKENKKEDQ